MANDHEIGRIVAVDTAEVTIELSRDLKALTRSTYEGTVEVGRINSYIIIPVGARRIVAMVTRVFLTEDSELKADKTMVALPSSRRLVKATLIGTIDEGEFTQGISLFPVLDSPVLIAPRHDLDAIFGKVCQKAEAADADEPGYCIPVGQSVVFPDYEVKIDPDAFFGKHAAIIGSTGSGKTCSVATILQSVIKQKAVKQTRFIILDTNGEYRAAFNPPDFRCLYIPTDPSESERLAIPYWFMDSDDFVRLFRASPGVQRPVLLNALSSARDCEGQIDSWLHVRHEIIIECNRILACCAGSETKDAKSIRQICDGICAYLAAAAAQVDTLSAHYPEATPDALRALFEGVRDVAREGLRNEGVQFEAYTIIDVDKRRRIEGAVRPFLGAVSRLPVDGTHLNTVSADCPRYFSKQRFRHQYLENAMSRDEAGSSRAREDCSTMLLRIHRLLEDSRFEFLFGPTSDEWPNAQHVLAAFLRDILGLESNEEKTLTEEEALGPAYLPFYDRQRSAAHGSDVVIVDLSLLASEVLENVTALIGRLIHEFLLRLSDQPVSGIERGEFPVVLVLEEAQNYIREGRDEEESISKQVFERIAKEGRKFGLGMLVASQRPSELSKTVLSQCNSFIVHRMQNPADLQYFREIVPAIYKQLLDQLPALAPRCALVLGECVQAPALVKMREVNPAPRSKNPKFYKSWTSHETLPDVEAVCSKWEGSVNEIKADVQGSEIGAAADGDTADVAAKDLLSPFDGETSSR